MAAKYYVVWKGRQAGIYDNWEACKAQVDGFPDPKYKSYKSLEEAKKAFQKSYTHSIFTPKKDAGSRQKGSIVREAICVDAACSGNPGDMEYRGVDFRTGQELFRKGPYRDGTNNIGEFLAIVHALAWMKRNQIQLSVYSDSITALAWIRNKKAKTKLEDTGRNAEIFQLVERAERFLMENDISTFELLKWETEDWGENPADFGRK